MMLMVEDYCRGHHAAERAADDAAAADREASAGVDACPQCRAFLRYADARLDHCPYGEDKPTCANCPIHCYKREPREFARTVMRYAGPRMLWRHPVLAVLHLVDGRRRVAHPMERRRAERAAAARQEGAAEGTSPP
jgi:hypothetical protein